MCSPAVRGVQSKSGDIEYLKDVLPRMNESLRSKINVLGQKSTDEILELRRSHQIAVIASRYELFGYTILEAMAAEQTIISTNVEGPSEIITTGNDGILVEPDSPQQMADAITSVLENPERGLNLASSAKATVVSTYGSEVIANKLVKFLRDKILQH